MTTSESNQSRLLAIARNHLIESAAVASLLVVAGCSMQNSSEAPTPDNSTAPTTPSASSSPTHSADVVDYPCTPSQDGGGNYTFTARFGKQGGTPTVELSSKKPFTAGDQYVANATKPSDLHGSWVAVAGFNPNRSTKVAGDDGDTRYVMEFENKHLGNHEETLVTSGHANAAISCEATR